MSNDILLGGSDGHIAVTRETGGTLMSDRADTSSIGAENSLVSMSEKQRSKLDRRVAGVKTTGESCECAMPTLRRGNPSRVCLNCGGTVA